MAFMQLNYTTRNKMKEGTKKAREKTLQIICITESKKETKSPEVGNDCEAGKKRIILKHI